jgi:anti-anti-sigma regulatory factor
MTGLEMQLEESGELVRVRLSGSFDGRTAIELRRVLEALGQRRVVLDFTQVLHFVDFAVAVLTRELDRQQLNVELRGLPLHQERVFGYFGLGARLPARGPYSQAEELFAS